MNLFSAARTHRQVTAYIVIYRVGSTDERAAHFSDGSECLSCGNICCSRPGDVSLEPRRYKQTGLAQNHPAKSLDSGRMADRGSANPLLEEVLDHARPGWRVILLHDRGLCPNSRKPARLSQEVSQ